MGSPTSRRGPGHRYCNHARYLKTLHPFPRNPTEEQKEKVTNICRNANLLSIAETCKYPDWLGYLGLVLVHMFSGAESYKKLSENWASQLSELVSEGSAIRMRLAEIAEGNGVLDIKDLEACEAPPWVGR